MKKRVAIYVEKEIWIELRKRCLDLGCSVGDYLVGLHKTGNVVKASKAEKSTKYEKAVEGVGMNQNPPFEVNADKIAELRATGYFSPQPKKESEPVKETPFHRMRRLHPNDMCMKCRELNKNCKCEGLNDI